MNCLSIMKGVRRIRNFSFSMISVQHTELFFGTMEQLEHSVAKRNGLIFQKSAVSKKNRFFLFY